MLRITTMFCVPSLPAGIEESERWKFAAGPFWDGYKPLAAKAAISCSREHPNRHRTFGKAWGTLPGVIINDTPGSSWAGQCSLRPLCWRHWHSRSSQLSGSANLPVVYWPLGSVLSSEVTERNAPAAGLIPMWTGPLPCSNGRDGPASHLGFGLAVPAGEVASPKCRSTRPPS